MVEAADGLEISETAYRANSRDKPRRTIMVRQEITKRPNAASKQVRRLGLFREREQLRQIPLQLSCHQSQTAGQDRIRFASRKSGFREQNQGTEV